MFLRHQTLFIGNSNSLNNPMMPVGREGNRQRQQLSSLMKTYEWLS